MLVVMLEVVVKNWKFWAEGSGTDPNHLCYRYQLFLEFWFPSVSLATDPLSFGSDLIILVPISFFMRSVASVFLWFRCHYSSGSDPILFPWYRSQQFEIDRKYRAIGSDPSIGLNYWFKIEDFSVFLTVGTDPFSLPSLYHRDLVHFNFLSK